MKAGITQTTSTWDIEARRAYQRAYYHRTKERRKELAKNHNVSKEAQREGRQRFYYRRKALIARYKAEPCLDCGNSYPPAAMDFHHTSEDKEMSIGKSASVSLVRLEAEIAKCVVLCANCHRLRHVGLR